MQARDKYSPADEMFEMFLHTMFGDNAFRTPNEPAGIVGTYKGIPVRAVPAVHKIYFNNRHTTIEWIDGVKTTVGCIEGQEFDEYGGFAAAVLKRMFGSSKEAVRYMNDHKVVQPDPIKKVKRASTPSEGKTTVEQGA